MNVTTIATSRTRGARTGSRHARAALLTSTALLAAAALPSIAAAQDRLPRPESIAYSR
jgi:subtilase-type serine protease